MSYFAGAALQEAVFRHLREDTELSALDLTILDAPPPGSPRGTYVVIGSEDVIDRSDASGPGAEHRFSVTVLSDAAGFAVAKQIAAKLSAALADPPLELSVGRLVGLWFHQAQARRIEGGKGRKIELRFRARTEG
jgi:hypothetical protein